jgi:hypothetical protein
MTQLNENKAPGPFLITRISQKLAGHGASSVQCARGSSWRASLRTVGVRNLQRHVRDIAVFPEVYCANLRTTKSRILSCWGSVLRFCGRPILRDLAPCEGWPCLNFSARSGCCSDLKGCRALTRYGSSGLLAGGLSHGLGLWRHCGNLRCARLRRNDCLSEECCAGLLERILLHWAGLAHLGLLISSFFSLLPGLSLALSISAKSGAAEGWQRGPRTKLFPIVSNRLPSTYAADRIRRIYGKRLDGRKWLFFKDLRAVDFLLFFAAIVRITGTLTSQRDSAIRRPNVSPRAKTIQGRIPRTCAPQLATRNTSPIPLWCWILQRPLTFSPLPPLGFARESSGASQHSPLITRHSSLATHHSPLSTTPFACLCRLC